MKNLQSPQLVKLAENELKIQFPQLKTNPILLILMIINILMSTCSSSPNLHLLLATIYSYIVLIPHYRIHRVVKLQNYMTILLLYCRYQQLILSPTEQSLFCYVIVLIWGTSLFSAIVRAIFTFVFVSNVQIYDQLVIKRIADVQKYFRYFLVLDYFKYTSSLIQAAFCIRVGTWESFIKSAKYLVSFGCELIVHRSNNWIIFTILATLWYIKDNYKEFGVRRLQAPYTNQTSLISRSKLLYGYLLVILLEFRWAWGGPYVTIFSILRRLLKSYLKIECKLSAAVDRQKLSKNKVN